MSVEPYENKPDESQKQARIEAEKRELLQKLGWGPFLTTTPKGERAFVGPTAPDISVEKLRELVDIKENAPKLHPRKKPSDCTHEELKETVAKDVEISTRLCAPSVWDFHNKRLRVGLDDYDILVEDDYIADKEDTERKGQLYYGTSNSTDLTIKLSGKMNYKRGVNVLLHELIHAVIDDANMSSGKLTEEQCCHISSTGLLKVLLDPQNVWFKDMFIAFLESEG